MLYAVETIDFQIATDAGLQVCGRSMPWEWAAHVATVAVIT
jgi:hypothetical protein